MFEGALSPELVAMLRPNALPEWVGYVTPEEIHTLMEAGCRPAPRSIQIVRRAEGLKDGSPLLKTRWWFYFTPPNALGLNAHGPFAPFPVFASSAG